MLQFCRACLVEITDLNFVSITDVKDASQIRAKLSECVPEMVIDRVLNPVLCSLCVISLQSAYDFKTRCLLTEQRIINYIETVESKNITLEEIHNSKRKENSLPKFSNDLAYDSMDLDDLNNLLDGVLQNQLEVLDRRRENQEDAGMDDVVLNSECSSDIELDMEDNFYDEEENVDINSLAIKNCFVVLQKLPDELIKSSTTRYSDENNFKCSECDFSTAREKDLKRHETRIHKCEQRFACELCDDRFSSKLRLSKHMKIHPLTFKCNLCNYQSNRKNCFNNHLFAHVSTSEKTFCCKLCDYKGARLANLQNHMRTHSKRQNTCIICGTEFRSKYLLTEHMAVHTSEKPYVCTLCNFRTATKSRLCTHMRFKHTDRNVTCDICNRSVVSKKYLARHMQIHTGEKPFACKLCKYRTASRVRLHEHIRVHTGEKPFSCNLCKRRFAYKNNLIRHTHMHKKQTDNLVCTICEYKCESEFILTDHLKAHEAENVISCPSCKYITTSNTTFEEHLKTHLKEEGS